MISTTLQPSTTTSHTVNPASKSEKLRLTAQWITVDGKLICQWILASVDRALVPILWYFCARTARVRSSSRAPLTGDRQSL